MIVLCWLLGMLAVSLVAPAVIATRVRFAAREAAELADAEAFIAAIRRTP